MIAFCFAVALLVSAPPPPEVMPARLLRTLAHHPSGYDGTRSPIVAELLLGDLLFHSPAILGPRARALGLSCDSCHPNGATHPTLFIEGASDRPGNIDLTTQVFHAYNDDRSPNALNIPSLRGLRYSSPYGRDGRTTALTDFLHNVIISEFGGAPLEQSRLFALVRYVQDFDYLPNRNLDAQMRLAPHVSERAKAGEAHFRRSCARCHVPSTYFRDGLAHRHTTGKTASPYSLDDAFETPTLLGTAETAPYFHDGRHATLEEVLVWYDRAHTLGLDASARAELGAYLEAIGAVDEPRDRRPLTRRLAERFAYLLLLDGTAYAEDAEVCRMSIDEIIRAIAAEKMSIEVEPRVRAAENSLVLLRRDCGKNIGARAAALHRELVRLAADWSGALSRAP